jgi:hypothetical protein
MANIGPSKPGDVTGESVHVMMKTATAASNTNRVSLELRLPMMTPRVEISSLWP